MVKYSHKNRNCHVPCVHGTKYNREHISVISVGECSHPGINSTTGERVQLMGSNCNSLPLATPQSAFIHRQHKGFHEELLSLDLFAAWAGAGGLSHCSCLVLITKDQTEGHLTLSHCHCGRFPQSTKRGDGGCSDVGQGLQYSGSPCAMKALT